jgi:hypothetical protein
MHGRQAAGWILLSISCFQIFQQVSTIFILADLRVDLLLLLLKFLNGAYVTDFAPEREGMCVGRAGERSTRPRRRTAAGLPVGPAGRPVAQPGSAGGDGVSWRSDA